MGEVGPGSTRGDLLFVTPDTSDPVEMMIKKYDRGDYTHVGLDDGAGNILSCRLGQESLREARHGGVVRDPQSAFAGRLARASVKVPDAQKERAVAFAENLADTGAVDRSGFSLAKMFACAAAVDFSDPSRRFSEPVRAEVVDAARDVAVTWRYTEEFPFFFCAELVVVAYGLEVPASYLPPPPDPNVHGPVDLDVPLVTGPLMTEDDDDARHRALRHLFVAVADHDPLFFGEAGLALARWYLTRHDGAAPGRQRPIALRPRALPAGLVTPRMLLRCTDRVGPAVPLGS